MGSGRDGASYLSPNITNTMNDVSNFNNIFSSNDLPSLKEVWRWIKSLI